MANQETFKSGKKISLQEAIHDWEEKNQPKKLCDEEWVDLIFSSISDLDPKSLEYIGNCTKLSLSSNFISKLPEFHLDKIKILSLGRNKIKAVRGLDYIGKTLEQLWISYNEIERLDGFKNLVKLQKLYISNNLIKVVDELNNLTHLEFLTDVTFKGNPFTLEAPNNYDSKPQDKKREEIFPLIKERLPHVEMIDGDTV